MLHFPTDMVPCVMQWFDDTVCVDRLTPCYWLTFQPHNHLAVEKLAKTCKALKVALNHLESYYSSFTDADTYQDQVYPVCQRPRSAVEMGCAEDRDNLLFSSHVMAKKMR